MSDNLENNNLIARWLEGSLTPEEQAELDRTKELDDLKVIIDDINTWKVKKFDVEAGLQKLHQQKNKQVLPKKSGNVWWVRIAASIAILLTSYFAWNFFNHQDISVTTQIAEQKHVELPDGSSVTLDASSKISYNPSNWEDNRSIALNGQALFSVNKGNTFKVVTPNGTITVLGTEFNVKTGTDVLIVECYQGKVSVSNNKEEKIIGVGETITLQNQDLIQSTHQKPNPDWMKGFSTYDNTPLIRVVEDLQAYFDITIELPEKYHQLRYSGIVYHNNLNLALETIFIPMEIDYQISEKGIVVFK